MDVFASFIAKLSVIMDDVLAYFINISGNRWGVFDGNVCSIEAGNASLVDCAESLLPNLSNLLYSTTQLITHLVTGLGVYSP